MIAATSPARQPPGWQQQLTEAVTSPQQLCELLGLDPQVVGAGESPFPMRVPLAFVRRMRHGDYADPLLRQVLALREELRPANGYGADPLAEAGALRAPGLLQKYAGRALLITTATCAVHCRYCFRREYPYADAGSDTRRWQQALAAIAADPSIEEVILSGGDPLSLSNARLSALTDRLAAMPHVRRLRVHTRQPVVLPARVDAGLCRWLASLPWRPVVVLHVNHAQELDQEVGAACEALRQSGAQLLNQSVLLAGVNDTGEALCALSRALWHAGVLPYYLHLLDRVRGASHFAVPETRALQLQRHMLNALPGYLVPRLVREQPGAASKRPVFHDAG
jgi:L-lysine 2,3-aminomutase